MSRPRWIEVTRPGVLPGPSVLVLVDPDEREALLRDDRGHVPAYLGAYGWIGLDLTEDTDWDETSELLDASHRRTAGSRRVAVLDARGARKVTCRATPRQPM